MKQPLYYRMFGYDLNLLPNPHLRSLEDGVQNIDEARQRTGATIGYPGWGLIYHLLLSHLDRSRFEVLIETGSNLGCTAIILAQALVDAGTKGRLHGIEIDAENAECARSNLRQARLSEVAEIHHGDSSLILPELLPEITAAHGPIRFAFLDASHLCKDVTREFELMHPHLASDAIVMFDNTYRIAGEGEDPRVNGALKTIVSKFGGNLINLEFVSWFTPGLAIWQRQPNL